MCGLLARSLGPSSDLEELVQAVFRGLVRNFDAPRAPAALRGFLIGIASREAKPPLRDRRARTWLGFGIRARGGAELPERVGSDGVTGAGREATDG